ncbi:hypothetical protein LZ31DRAFT_550746 [Colletotrichum somersetense]|nr:hypothetical protein LZ31DRAFT_550746 [Colletotrichum somersetense]
MSRRLTVCVRACLCVFVSTWLRLSERREKAFQRSRVRASLDLHISLGLGLIFFLSRKEEGRGGGVKEACSS